MPHRRRQRSQKPLLSPMIWTTIATGKRPDGHLFRETGLGGELATQQQHYGRTVEEIYVFADEMVGQFMKELEPDNFLYRENLKRLREDGRREDGRP